MNVSPSNSREMPHTVAGEPGKVGARLRRADTGHTVAERVGWAAICARLGLGVYAYQGWVRIKTVVDLVQMPISCNCMGQSRHRRNIATKVADSLAPSSVQCLQCPCEIFVNVCRYVHRGDVVEKKVG